MNILFLTLVWPESDERHFFSDLMEEFRNAGHLVYVVGARERRVGKPTESSFENGIHVLRVRCGNIQKTNNIEKGISSVFLGYRMHKEIKKYFSGVRFDLILYCIPPVTLAATIGILKKKYNSKTYLLLKDIWPQGAVDLGMIRKGGFVWRYFRWKEKRIYDVSDYIGCMSPANTVYVLKHNPQIPQNKVEECPNSIRPGIYDYIESSTIHKRCNIPEEAVKFIFGGNIGKPQGMGFLVDAAEQLKDRKDVFFIVVGSGTEYQDVEKKMKEKNCCNMMLLQRLPRADYEELCAASDVGLILLDQRFTIPNFPSRLLSYLDRGMPVLCATDPVCDMGDIVEEWGCGIKVLHGDVKGFISAVERLADDKEQRRRMAVNARKLLEERYTAKQSYNIIISHFEG